MEGFCTALSSLMSVSFHSHEPCPRPVAPWHGPLGTPSVAQEATSKDALLLEPTRTAASRHRAAPLHPGHIVRFRERVAMECMEEERHILVERASPW